MPFSPLQLLAFIFLLGLLLAFIQVGILTVAFEKLGLSPQSTFVLLLASLLGSGINLPITTIRAERPDLSQWPDALRDMLEQSLRRFHGQTLIAINVGGGLIPILFSYYLLSHHPLGAGPVILAIAVVALVAYLASRPVPGLGIGMPVFVAPIAAALTAVAISPEHSAPLAYICGTLGVLIGADLLRLKDIRRMGAPIASIGGAGTFDGIFITGIVAVLLA
ncbi:MAG TPA: DUF1614 domain-containing protein [Gammaproteobacteria bacterium]|nr:DUF1614 domain-containing protein [Gammaproteobacteria bacterium]